MYLCRCDGYVSPPGHLIISQLLSFCISSTAASNSNVFYTSIEILILAFPSLLRTRLPPADDLPKSPAHQVSPQASIPAFVNPCCATFASRRYREAFLFSEPSPTAPFINISLVDLALSFFSFFSLSLCLFYTFLFSLAVLLAKEKRFICLRICISRKWTKSFQTGH